MPRWAKAASGFTSGTTNGTSGSIRKALELSITTAPARAATGAHWRDTEPPAEASTTSTPSKAEASTGRIASDVPCQAMLWPAERGDARGISSATGKLRSASNSSNSWPTAPVAPSTATRKGRLARQGDGGAGTVWAAVKGAGKESKTGGGAEGSKVNPARGGKLQQRGRPSSKPFFADWGPIAFVVRRYDNTRWELGTAAF